MSAGSGSRDADRRDGRDTDLASQEETLVRCPRCGLVSEGVRCERCNALKITECSGACTMCGLSRCVAPKKREQSGL